MKLERKRFEVLSPAGDMERLEMAILYGADAVYLAGTEFGMRAAAGNFTNEELKTAVEYAHSHGVRTYVTCNTIPDDSDLPKLPSYLQYLESIDVDAVIISDLGVLALCKKYAPSLEIHISTQAGVMNSESAKMLYELGAKRVVLAREMSLENIKLFKKNIPEDLEVEAFCHGAMCMSFSGRCVISNYLTGRDANKGQCAQPCRWKYKLIEEKRPNEEFEITENGGTYLFNSKDMCMIDHVKELLDAGITSIKIEGRTKSTYYVSSATAAYRHAADAALENRELEPIWRDEVNKLSHRPYSTGFFYGYPGQYAPDACYLSGYDVVAMVTDCDENGNATLRQRNRFFINDEVELLMPSGEPVAFTVDHMTDSEGEEIEATRHADMEFHMHLPVCAPKFSFLRKKRVEDKSGHKIQEQQ